MTLASTPKPLSQPSIPLWCGGKSTGVLKRVARAADGSARDGLSLLDQAIAQAEPGTPIGAEAVAEMLGLSDRAAVFDLFEAVMAGQPAAALAITDRAHERGADLGVMLQDLLELVHTVTRLKSVPGLRDNAELRKRALLPRKEVQLHLPIAVAGYTDFYSSKEHATNVGVMFRGKDNALQPNWLHIPIAYNGRASTVVVSGTEVRRPRGQLKPPTADAPSFGPCKRLDFELEMGVVVGGASPMGEMLTEAEAEAMIFGFVLLNDWSARDIQQWEYVPLGPFQAKAFATSISPWVVTREALEPFRVKGPVQDPQPLSYLRQNGANNYDLNLDVELRANGAKNYARIARTNFKYMYWSSVQQLVHHASGGCAMNVGDLLGSGTISGPEKNQRGSLLEISWNGTEPLDLPGGDKRTFLEDGDSLVMRGWCQGDGYRVGFGEVEGTIRAAGA